MGLSGTAEAVRFSGAAALPEQGLLQYLQQ